MYPLFLLLTKILFEAAVVYAHLLLWSEYPKANQNKGLERPPTLRATVFEGKLLGLQLCIGSFSHTPIIYAPLLLRQGEIFLLVPP